MPNKTCLFRFGWEMGKLQFRESNLYKAIRGINHKASYLSRIYGPSHSNWHIFYHIFLAFLNEIFFHKHDKNLFSNWRDVLTSGSWRTMQVIEISQKTIKHSLRCIETPPLMVSWPSAALFGNGNDGGRIMKVHWPKLNKYTQNKTSHWKCGSWHFFNVFLQNVPRNRKTCRFESLQCSQSWFLMMTGGLSLLQIFPLNENTSFNFWVPTTLLKLFPNGRWIQQTNISIFSHLPQVILWLHSVEVLRVCSH